MKSTAGHIDVVQTSIIFRRIGICLICLLHVQVQLTFYNERYNSYIKAEEAVNGLVKLGILVLVSDFFFLSIFFVIYEDKLLTCELQSRSGCRICLGAAKPV